MCSISINEELLTGEASDVCHFLQEEVFILLRLHKKVNRTYRCVLEGFCGVPWWRKPEKQVKTTNLGWMTTILPQANTRNQTLPQQ